MDNICFHCSSCANWKGDRFAFWICPNAFSSKARVQRSSRLCVENICSWTVQLAVAEALFIYNKIRPDNLVWNSHRYFHRNHFVREYNFRLNFGLNGRQNHYTEILFSNTEYFWWEILANEISGYSSLCVNTALVCVELHLEWTKAVLKSTSLSNGFEETGTVPTVLRDIRYRWRARCERSLQKFHLSIQRQKISFSLSVNVPL